MNRPGRGASSSYHFPMSLKEWIVRQFLQGNEVLVRRDEADAGNVPVVWPWQRGLEFAARRLPHRLGVLLPFLVAQPVAGAVSPVVARLCLDALGHLVVVGDDRGMRFLRVHDGHFPIHGSVMRHPFRDLVGTLAHLEQGALDQVLDLLFAEPLPDAIGGHDLGNGWFHGTPSLRSRSGYRQQFVEKVKYPLLRLLGTLRWAVYPFTRLDCRA